VTDEIVRESTMSEGFCRCVDAISHTSFTTSRLASSGFLSLWVCIAWSLPVGEYIYETVRFSF